MNTTTTTTTITDANIAELLSALTHDNWFTQLAVLSDAYRESGDDAKADRCDDLRLAGKRPEKSGDNNCSDGLVIYIFRVDYATIVTNEEWRLPKKTVYSIDKTNDAMFTERIQDQLTAYLQVPEHLRIARPKS